MVSKMDLKHKESMPSDYQIKTAKREVEDAKLQYALALNNRYRELYYQAKAKAKANGVNVEGTYELPLDDEKIVEYTNDDSIVLCRYYKAVSKIIDAPGVGLDYDDLLLTIKFLTEQIDLLQPIVNSESSSLSREQVTVARSNYLYAETHLKELENARNQSNLNISSIDISKINNSQDQVLTKSNPTSNKKLIVLALLLAIGAAATLAAIYLPEHMLDFMSVLVNKLDSLKNILVPTASTVIGASGLFMGYEAAKSLKNKWDSPEDDNSSDNSSEYNLLKR